MLNDYPEVLSVKDICSILHIGRTTAYRLLQDGVIANRRIGRTNKVSKDVLIEYLNNQE